MLDPGCQDVGDLEAVGVLHQHVRVALDPDGGQQQQLGAPARLVGLFDELGAGLEPGCPARGKIDVIAKQHHDRHARVRLEVAVGCRAGSGLDRDDRIDSGSVERCGLEGKDAGLRVADQNRLLELPGQFG